LKKLKTIITVLLLVVTFLLIVFFVITRVQGKTPELFGYQILRVVTPSMEPELKVGDIILTKRVDDITQIKVDDIITYNGESGSYNGKLVTHKVIVEPYKRGDKYFLQTQGIANDFTDPEVRESQVVGKMVASLPVIAALYNFFMSPWGLAVLLIILALLFFSEVLNLRKIIKEPPKDEVETSDRDSDDADDSGKLLSDDNAEKTDLTE